MQKDFTDGAEVLVGEDLSFFLLQPIKLSVRLSNSCSGSVRGMDFFSSANSVHDRVPMIVICSSINSNLLNIFRFFISGALFLGVCAVCVIVRGEGVGWLEWE